MSPRHDSTPKSVNLQAWIARAKNDPLQHRYRQIVEIVLHAISHSSQLQRQMYLKGGTLMALAYGSPRFTGDLDASWLNPLEPDTDIIIHNELDRELIRATNSLGYVDLACKVQRITKKPRAEEWTTHSFPALQVTIGYAQQGTSEHKKLAENNATSVLKIDINFNENIETAETLLIDRDAINTYGLPDIFAEKIRALLQQTQRKHERSRRQDIYDLALLSENFPPGTQEKAEILRVLHRKTQSHNVTFNRNSLADAAVKNLAKSEWHTLKTELNIVPDFEECYQKVQYFYESLPWEKPLA